MPITRVLDESGDVLHDCTESGCSVSWDGYALRDVPLEELALAGGPAAQSARPLQAGERVEGAVDPGARWEALDESTVRRRPK